MNREQLVEYLIHHKRFRALKHGGLAELNFRAPLSNGISIEAAIHINGIPGTEFVEVRVETSMDGEYVESVQAIEKTDSTTDIIFLLEQLKRPGKIESLFQ